MRVKICGITNLEDALCAAEAGADYLGFIFYPTSKRSIDTMTCQAIVRQLRGRSFCPILVGVFVNEDGQRIAEVLSHCQLDLAQLSGDEVPSLVGDRASPIYGRCYKAIRPTSIDEAESEAEWFLPPPESHSPDHPTLLVDTYHPDLRGGTGETADWSISASLALRVTGLMLAGGLNPQNVESAIEQVRPYAVDVASGVESCPGKKDHSRVQAFISRAKKI